MGIQSDQEILQMIGGDEMIATAMIPCFEECHQHQVYTQLQVIIGVVYGIVISFCTVHCYNVG